MKRIILVVAVFAPLLSAGACEHAKPALIPLANVAGKRILLPAVEKPTVTGADCAGDAATLDTLPQRLHEAASTALAGAGFLVVEDAAQPHDYDAKVDSEVTYCNPSVHIANGTAGLSILKGGAVVHRSADQGELTSAPAMTSLFGDIITKLMHDPAVIAATGPAPTPSAP